MDIFDLFATIKLDSTEYEQGLQDAETKASSFGSKLSSGLGTAAKVGTVAVGAMAAGVTAASAAFVKSTGDIASYGDDIDKMSQKLGMSAESYQEWDAIMQHSGASIDSMTRGMTTLSKAAENNAEEFRLLGISEEELQNMNQEELFARTIEGLQSMESGTERTVLAQKLLGGSAKELGALLNTSAEDTEAMRQKVHELGGVMSDEAVKAAAKYQDTLQDMTTAIDGIKRGLISDFLPSVTTVMEGITELFSGDSDKGLSLISDGIDDLINGITDKLPKVLEVGSKIIQSILMAITNNLPKIIEAGTNVLLNLVQGLVENLPTILKAGIDAILTFQKGIAQALPELIPAAVDAILEFVDALIDNLPEIIDAGMQLTIGLATGLIEAIPKIIERLPEIITSIVEALVKSAPKIAEAGVKLLTSLVQNLPKIISDIVAAVPKIISGIVGAIGEGVSAMVEAGKNLLGGLGDGLIKGVTGVIDKAKNAAGNILSAVKGFFGIASPSKEFMKIGAFLMQGMSKGIDDNIDQVYDSIDDLEDVLDDLDDTFSDYGSDVQIVSLADEKGQGGSNIGSDTEKLTESFVEALRGMGVMLDGNTLVGGITTRMNSSLGMQGYYHNREVIA